MFPITGGPCSGKTTAIDYLLKHQSDIFPNYNVDVVPEAATLYHQYGGRLPFGQPASKCGRVSENGRNLLWELLLNELKRTLEARTVNAALESPRPSIVLCDRGIFDSRAYLPTTRDWQQMLDLAGWEEKALACRYDHVFHMRMCPREAYTSENNAARRETYEEALALDAVTWKAWHPTHGDGAHVNVGGADGDDSIDGKLDALADAMRARIGVDLDGGVARALAARGTAARAGAAAAAAAVDEDDSSADSSSSSSSGGSGGSTSTVARPPAVIAPPPTPKKRGWYLPPEAIIALADTVACSPDLGQIAPTAVSIVRRIRRVDDMLPVRRGRAASAFRESAWRTAQDIGDRSGMSRDIANLAGADPDSPLAF